MTERASQGVTHPWLGWATLAAGAAAMAGVGLLMWQAALGLAALGLVIGAAGLAHSAGHGGRGAGFGIAGLVFVAVGTTVSLLLPTVFGTGNRVEAGPARPTAPFAPSHSPTPRAPDTPTPRSSAPGVPEPVVLVPSSAVASSTSPDSADAAGRTVNFDANNLLDGDPSTAWRSDGTAPPVTIRVTFPRPVHLTRIDMVPGYAKVDPTDGTDRFTQNSRVATARFALDDGAESVRRFTDRPVPQGFDLSDDTTTVQITVLTATPGARPYVAISDVVFQGWER
jgi:hypothetical protein